MTSAPHAAFASLLAVASLAVTAAVALAQPSASVSHASVQSYSGRCPAGYSATRATGGTVCARCESGTMVTHATGGNPVCVSCRSGTPGWNGQGYVCR
jgi:hypothetical protein